MLFSEKKKPSLNKMNYIPVSLLSHILKKFERFVCRQIAGFMSKELPTKLCSFVITTIHK